MDVIGIDGYRGGWVAVVLRGGRFVEALLAEGVAEVLAHAPDAVTVGIDIPIGLPATGHRRADELARARLGERRSSVFLAPPRDVVTESSYPAANALAKDVHGFGISKQSYALRSKILEVDPLARTDRRIHEVHPELAFFAMAGTPLASKKSYGGARRRLQLLANAGILLPDDLGPAGAAPLDDVVDAAAAAWVAHRIATGAATSLPNPPDIDATDVPMAIWV